MGVMTIVTVCSARVLHGFTLTSLTVRLVSCEVWGNLHYVFQAETRDRARTCHSAGSLESPRSITYRCRFAAAIFAAGAGRARRVGCRVCVACGDASTVVITVCVIIIKG